MTNQDGNAETPRSRTHGPEIRSPQTRHTGDPRQGPTPSHGPANSPPKDRQVRLDMSTAARQRTRAAPSTKTGPWRVLGRTLALPFLAAAVLMVALLMWWAVGTLSRGSTAEGQALSDVAAMLLPKPAATAVPAPTKTPGQIAVQFEPQLQVALSSGNWDRALEIVAIMGSVNPGGAKVEGWAFTTLMTYGQALVDQGQVDLALDQFEQAVALAPENAEARLWQQTTQLYLDGRDAFEAGQLESAIQSFSLAHEQLPSFGDLSSHLVEAYLGHAQEEMTAGDWTAAIATLTHGRNQLPDEPDLVDLLASAYGQRGIARHEAAMTNGIRIDVAKLEEAEADLDAALALRPNHAEARAVRKQVVDYLYPAKRIEVNITQQRVYAWQGDSLVYEFPVSTGLPGQDTATGNFQVLDKIPMAHSSVWRLDMPNWLGIYYVQGIENGFHALPFRPDGTKMWAGLLGQKASYGCIVLGTEAGRILYNWAEVGTRVDIHY